MNIQGLIQVKLNHNIITSNTVVHIILHKSMALYYANNVLKLDTQKNANLLTHSFVIL